ncbi:MAG TPA: MBL fold metallo-hydrolase [Thermodesulfobacteriota bacterium]
MRVASLASGSGGNALLVEAAGERLLVDCGLAPRELARRLALAGRRPADLTGLVLTHEHGDHVRGAAEVALALGVPVYGTAGTLRQVVAQAAQPGRAAADGGWSPPVTTGRERARLAALARPVAAGEPVPVGGVTLRPVALPHDAVEPVACVLDAEGVRVAIATDFGRPTAAVVSALAGADLLVLEFNHDAAMLAAGPYHPSVKRRVAGDRGHLSNAQAAEILAAVAHPRLGAVWLAHLSQVNNTPALALEAARGALRRRLPFEAVPLACLEQDGVREWSPNGAASR